MTKEELAEILHAINSVNTRLDRLTQRIANALGYTLTQDELDQISSS